MQKAFRLFFGYLRGFFVAFSLSEFLNLSQMAAHANGSGKPVMTKFLAGRAHVWTSQSCSPWIVQLNCVLFISCVFRTQWSCNMVLIFGSVVGNLLEEALLFRSSFWSFGNYFRVCAWPTGHQKTTIFSTLPSTFRFYQVFVWFSGLGDPKTWLVGWFRFIPFHFCAWNWEFFLGKWDWETVGEGLILGLLFWVSDLCAQWRVIVGVFFCWGDVARTIMGPQGGSGCSNGFSAMQLANNWNPRHLGAHIFSTFVKTIMRPWKKLFSCWTRGEMQNGVFLSLFFYKKNVF